MSISIADKLISLGRRMPEAPAPVANYVATVRVGHLLFVSGQISPRDPASPAHGRLSLACRAAATAAVDILAER